MTNFINFDILSKCLLCIIYIDSDGCPPNITTIPSQSKDPDLEIVIIWPETDIGQTASVDCPCGSLSSANGLNAIRYCGGDFILGGNWMEANVMSCNFSDLARQLCGLSNVILSIAFDLLLLLILILFSWKHQREFSG